MKLVVDIMPKTKSNCDYSKIGRYGKITCSLKNGETCDLNKNQCSKLVQILDISRK